MSKQRKEFEAWLVSDNIIWHVDKDDKFYYASQDALYRNKLYTKEQAWEYYKKEFIN
tara:strand:+ start:90 stop:260 length:171 start_codon:yes stop_codon:yes gene_type:complete